MQAQHFDHTVVIILDPDALSSGVEQTTSDCLKLAEQSSGKVVELDLAQVQFVNGTGLGTLIRLHKRMQDSGSRLVLRNPGALVAEVLRVTHLDRLLAIVREPEADPSLVVPADLGGGRERKIEFT